MLFCLVAARGCEIPISDPPESRSVVEVRVSTVSEGIPLEGIAIQAAAIATSEATTDIFPRQDEPIVLAPTDSNGVSWIPVRAFGVPPGEHFSGKWLIALEFASVERTFDLMNSNGASAVLENIRIEVVDIDGLIPEPTQLRLSEDGRLIIDSYLQKLEICDHDSATIRLMFITWIPAFYVDQLDLHELTNGQRPPYALDVLDHLIGNHCAAPVGTEDCGFSIQIDAWAGTQGTVSRSLAYNLSGDAVVECAGAD